MMFKSTIKLYYNEKSKNDLSKFQALVEGNKMKFLPVDINSEQLTSTRLLKLAEKCDDGLRGLIDHDSELFKTKLVGKRYDEKDLLNVLRTNPQILSLPIAESRKEVRTISNPRDLLKFKRIKEDINPYEHQKN